MQDYYTYPARTPQPATGEPRDSRGFSREDGYHEPHDARGFCAREDGYTEPPERLPAERRFGGAETPVSPISRRKIEEGGAQALLFLRPEQIRVPARTEGSRATRNAIIRQAGALRRYGMVEPLSVRPMSENGYPYYELVGPDLLYRAACLAGIQKLPCAVLAADDLRCAQSAVMERLRGQQLNIFEQASAYRMLLQDYRLTQDEIARQLGVSQSTVANKLRLLRFSEQERNDILAAGLSERHARALLRLSGMAERRAMLETIVAEGLNVAQAEARVEEYLTRRVALAPKPVRSIQMRTEPRGTLPRKFAIQDLTPLYNSIEKTLAIFRKTGVDTECLRQESENGVEILIRIPRHA